MRLAMMKREIHLAVLALQYGIDKVLLSSDDEPEPEPEPVQQPSSGSDKMFQALDSAHFIPLTNSPGNQIKLMIDYSVVDPTFVGELMTGTMEVYAANNNSLIRTSSLSDPVIANQSGSVQFATTFTDESLNSVRTEATFTVQVEWRQYLIPSQ